MLIPIKHENMTARRWPLVTFSLVAVNTLVFLATFQTLKDQQKHLSELKLHMVLLAASHPELKLSPEAQEVVGLIRERYPKNWAELQAPNRPAVDSWERTLRTDEDPIALQARMDSLEAELAEAQAASLTERYAFIPAHPKPLAYVTANFLHAGWLHLIGNMWFLWLAGFVLEDFWGRSLYTAFYLAAGAAALAFDRSFHVHSLVPTLGASGAVAALMGAFLVRFPKMRIEMLWLAFVRFRFKAPAYCLLPAWLLMELLYGSLFGQATGVAHWAHVGGFLFGALAALALRYSGLEHRANQQIEEKLTLACDPEIQQASELIDAGRLDQAAEILRGYAQRHPDSIDAFDLLRQIHLRRNDQAACREILSRICALHLKAKEDDLAWKAYEEFLAAGGARLAPEVWFELGRSLETRNDWQRAVAEYEKLAAAYPAERQAILSQLAAARVYLKRLNQPRRALELYQAAAGSSVPHLDWEQVIAIGLREAKSALGEGAAAAAGFSRR
jgi:membrane associated rhomboid family serine protease